ncbi:MAG TPA: acyltransferase [archaeon]|nr:acyltransferase [archaeon]
MNRSKRLQITKTEKNSLVYWTKFASPLKVTRNYLTIWLTKACPSLRLKNFLLKGTGIKIGKYTRIGLDVQFDVFFPELIEIGKNTIIGYNTTILVHEFLIKEFRKGKVKIGDNVLIGANCTILPGIEIGDNAVIGAMTLVNKDVPANCFAGGVPVRVIKRIRNKYLKSDN